MDGDDLDGLVGTEGDHEEVEDELPWEDVEPGILLEGTKGHPLDEIHPGFHDKSIKNDLINHLMSGNLFCSIS